MGASARISTEYVYIKAMYKPCAQSRKRYIKATELANKEVWVTLNPDEITGLKIGDKLPPEVYDIGLTKRSIKFQDALGDELTITKL